jgi:hypothetical protein
MPRAHPHARKLSDNPTAQEALEVIAGLGGISWSCVRDVCFDVVLVGDVNLDGDGDVDLGGEL